MTTLKSGTLLHNGVYVIERVLGKGGFGITYLARHVRLKKLVAIKEFFPSSLCNREGNTSVVTSATDANTELVSKLKSKFLKEAEHIAEMNSPYIVRITDVFEANGTAYYIMDYIEGETIDQLVRKRGAISIDEAVEYIKKIGEALTYVHSKRINHLDVKPANIIVRSMDNSPILVDFGLSKRYNAKGSQTSTTPVGVSHGYAPGEQYKAGGVTEFSPQTDVYSLAATLYYMLTGVTPPHAMDLAETDLDIPSIVPTALAAVIRKAMSLKRCDRHKDVASFVHDVESATQSGGNDSGATQANFSENRFNKYDAGATELRTDKDGRTRGGGIVVKILLGIAAIGLIGALILLFVNKTPGHSEIIADTAIAVNEEVTSDTEAVTAAVESPQEEYGAPLSIGDKKEGMGGFDDNAEGYFQQYADVLMTQNRDVSYEGTFSDGKGNYPIHLKFELDDNYFPGVCYYTNIDYNVKLKMSVRFTEEEMIIKGNASGSLFLITLHPTTGGSWAGTAKNGNHELKAAIRGIEPR